ncbi:hypothetical protein [Paraburkholderia sp. UCT2]|uniref:hypothetical protein n=1 Tax=Paraburkholderia sp. UCT2 TaxID=2615208 RepID=UPI00223BF2C7|nr:hypothetical protein [Paraburkholderia sp. UCT2]
MPTVPGAPELNWVFGAGTRALSEEVSNPFERGCAFFLFGALQQFFFDGNEKMVRFYLSKDGTEMMAFLRECHPGE